MIQPHSSIRTTARLIVSSRLQLLRSSSSATRTTSVALASLNASPYRSYCSTVTLRPIAIARRSAASVNQIAQARSFSDHGEKKGSPQALSDFDLSGKVIIVTGAAGGLGVVQTEALLEAGATVYALDRRQDPGSALTALQARAKQAWGTELHYRQIDVCDNPGLNTTIEAIASAHTRLDGLLACAGIQQETPALDMPQADTNVILETNVTGVFMTAQAVARQMMKYGGGGSMALIASMSGYAANRGLLCAAYNSSKAAVHQLARSLAAEWGEHGIRVNTISPGYIVTPMVEALFEQFPDRKVGWPKDNMLGRLSYPQDYRGAAIFLLSDASSFMTGADMRIDGGHMAW